MKILIIRNSSEQNFGGAERLAVMIAEELEANKLTAAVISRQTKLLAYAKSEGVSSLRGVWWSKQNWSGTSLLILPLYLCWQIALFVWYLWVIIRQNAAALHIMSKDDFIAGTLAGKALGKRVIWTDTADLKYIYANHNRWYKNPVGKLVYLMSRSADVVTLVSKSEQSLIEERLGHSVPSNYHVIYMVGRDENVTSSIQTEPKTVTFCATSRLVIAKGIGELIEAFNILSPDNPDYRLWIVGDGPDQDQFRAEAKENAFITFLGHQDTPLQYLTAADIYVHPTHHEGFSLGLAEAAMLAKPIIATNVGGNPELVGDKNGILVPVKDPKALADAMRHLANDPSARESMGKSGRRDFVEKFDLTKVTKRDIIPLYEKTTH